MAKYYLCSVCGNMVEMIEDKGNTPFCCNRPMQEQIPGSTDGAVEKHIPCISITPVSDGLQKVEVTVGSEPHPSETFHYITWIALKTEKGTHYSKLTPGCKPKATFYICSKDMVQCAYAYCNLHGLWMGGVKHE